MEINQEKSQNNDNPNDLINKFCEIQSLLKKESSLRVLCK